MTRQHGGTITVESEPGPLPSSRSASHANNKRPLGKSGMSASAFPRRTPDGVTSGVE